MRPNTLGIVICFALAGNTCFAGTPEKFEFGGFQLQLNSNGADGGWHVEVKEGSNSVGQVPTETVNEIGASSANYNDARKLVSAVEVAIALGAKGTAEVYVAPGGTDVFLYEKVGSDKKLVEKLRYRSEQDASAARGALQLIAYASKDRNSLDASIANKCRTDLLEISSRVEAIKSERISTGLNKQLDQMGIVLKQYIDSIQSAGTPAK